MTDFIKILSVGIILLSQGTLQNVNAFQKWNALRATWCMNANEDPINCFLRLPLTSTEALENGWIQSSEDCENDGKFNGIRFTNGTHIGVTPLYDINGIIAGVQINYEKEQIYKKPNKFEFENVSIYLDNSIDGRDVFSTTYYFIEPRKICNKGRTESDLKKQGTGIRLYQQTGPTPKYLFKLPIYRSFATETKWTEKPCINRMGHHNYYKVESLDKEDCRKFISTFLIYNNNGELHGFGNLGFGPIETEPNFEHPNRAASNIAMGKTEPIPKCLAPMADSPGLSNMHLFFSDEIQEFSCTDLKQTPFGNDPYVNPNSKKSSKRQKGLPVFK